MSAILYKSNFYVGVLARQLRQRPSAVAPRREIFDVVHGGGHKIYGTTKAQIDTDVQEPVDRLVVLLHGVSFIPIRRTWSLGGQYRFEKIKAGEYAVVSPDYAGNYNMSAWGVQQSVSMDTAEQ